MGGGQGEQDGGGEGDMGRGSRSHKEEGISIYAMPQVLSWTIEAIFTLHVTFYVITHECI
jgi:hypothetical protein